MTYLKQTTPYGCGLYALANMIHEFIPFEPNSSIPILIDIQTSLKDRPHIVYGELKEEGNLIIRDSLLDKEIETTLAEYEASLFRCYGLWHLLDYVEQKVLFRFYEPFKLQ
jgi:hypothetical protein